MRIHQIVQLTYQPQCLGVAFKLIEIRLHLLSQQFLQGPALQLKPSHMRPEPFPDHRLPEMPKGWIPNIVQQSGALQNITDISLVLRLKIRVFYLLQNLSGDVLSQRFAKGRHFQRMGEPGADKIALIQRKHLGLVLQPPEGGAADDPVIVLLIFRSQIFRAGPFPYRPYPLVAQQPAPLHGSLPPVSFIPKYAFAKLPFR